MVPMADKLIVDGISKWYESKSGVKNERVTILNEVNLSIRAGEIVSFIGPTGCGKTTLLRIIDGIIKPDSGQVLVNDKPVVGTKNSPCAMVFQSFNLLPWRTAKKNVEFGLEAKKVPPEDRSKKAEYYLALVGLSGYEKYHPHEMSGGMQQRVGLARAIAIDPEVVLLDEPFSSIDLLLRETLQEEVLKILLKTKKTAIFVTHNAEEAILLSDRIISFSTKPGAVKSSYTVDLPRARDTSDEEISGVLAKRKAMIEARTPEVYKLFQAIKNDLMGSMKHASIAQDQSKMV